MLLLLEQLHHCTLLMLAFGLLHCVPLLQTCRQTLVAATRDATHLSQCLVVLIQQLLRTEDGNSPEAIRNLHSAV
eukprot:COSAG01_NODE_21170_length_915_cov_0.920343_1_plen_74_part_10